MLRDACVDALCQSWPGVCTCEVTITAAPRGAEAFVPGERVRALAYTGIVGVPEVGDTVRIECSPLAKRLGTGGTAMITALFTRLPADDMPANGGHMVKARYMPNQVMCMSVEEQDSPYHDSLAAGGTLAGTPVIACDLHSMLAAAIAGVRTIRPRARVVYVMTDGAALPAAFSRQVAGLLEAGWLAECVTAGQAFGGGIEAISLPSALLAAKVVAEADVIIAAQGPGNAGTGTHWGFSGVDCAWTLVSAHALGGTPIGALRISHIDRRERHRGISHHSAAALGELAVVPCHLPVPALDGDSACEAMVHAACPDLYAQARAIAAQRHRVVTCTSVGLLEALRECPVRLSTMGRGLEEDPGIFLGAAAAGRYAAGLLD